MRNRPRAGGKKSRLAWVLAVLVLLVGGGAVAYHYLSLGAHSVIVVWSPSLGATSYNVYRSPVSGGPYARIGFTPRPSYVDRRVPAGILYYVVTAVVGERESKPSNEVRALIPES